MNRFQNRGLGRFGVNGFAPTFLAPTFLAPTCWHRCVSMLGHFGASRVDEKLNLIVRLVISTLLFAIFGLKLGYWQSEYFVKLFSLFFRS